MYKYILIPIDSANEEIKVTHFQHNGNNVYVPLGKVTKVPSWVIEMNPTYAIYEVPAPVDAETKTDKKSK